MSDSTLAGLRVSDPRTWSVTDWLSDLIPHLVYGTVTYATLVALERGDEVQGRPDTDVVTYVMVCEPGEDAVAALHGSPTGNTWRPRRSPARRVRIDRSRQLGEPELAFQAATGA